MRNKITLNWIKTQIVSGEYEFSSHAEEEREAERIFISEIESALINGGIVEVYSNDPRGSSCLVLGYGEQGCPIHIVCGKTQSGKLRVVTVYIPTLPKWIDDRTRRHKK